MFKTIRIIILIIRLSAKPYDTARVFDIVDYIISSRSKRARNNINQALQNNHEFKSFYEKLENLPHLRKPIQLHNLTSCKSGTFGHALYRYYTKNQINPHFYTYIDSQEPIMIIRNYLARTHDIWHLITGFGNSPFDEYGLQAFYLGQEVSMTAFCIMCGGFFEVLKSKDPTKVKEFMDKITLGYQKGKRAKYLMYVIWEDYFDMDFEKVKKELNV